MTISKKISAFLFFLYVMGVNAFKSGEGFDAIFCRLSFLVLIVFECFLFFSEPRKLSPILKWFFSFIAFYYISILWGDFDDGIYYNNNYIQIIGILLIYSYHIIDENEVCFYLKIMVFSLLCACFMLIPSISLQDFGTYRVGSELVLNSNSFGIRLALASICTLYFASIHKVYYLIYATFVFFILSSGSRTAFFVLIIGTSLFYVFKDRSIKGFLNIAFILIGLSAGTLYLLNVEERYSVLGVRLLSLMDNIIGTQTTVNGVVLHESSYELRQFFVRYGFKMFVDSYFMGYGANGFVTEMRRISPAVAVYSHNTYSEILSTLGIIGGVLYFAPQVYSLVHAVKKMFKRFSPYNSMCFALIVSFIVAQWGSITFIIPFYYLIIIPVMISCSNSYAEKTYVTTIIDKGSLINEKRVDPT